MVYCSSDGWAGNIAAEDATKLLTTKNVAGSYGWAFKGQRIIESTFAVLQAHFGLGSLPSSRLLYSGCSAGARGAMFNIDFIRPFIPADMELRGFLDSPMWVDELPRLATTVPLENQTQAVYHLVNATAVLDPACLQAYTRVISPGVYDSSEGWKCLYGQYRIPFLRTPFLISASQFDLFQLPYNEAAQPPYTGAELTYADGFQQAVRAVMSTLPTAQQPGSAAYSSACFKHCTSDLNTFWTVKIGDLNLKDYLSYWYFGGDTPAAVLSSTVDSHLPTWLPPNVMEDCTGFGCGQCHNETAAAAAAAGGLAYARTPPTGRFGGTPLAANPKLHKEARDGLLLAAAGAALLGALCLALAPRDTPEKADAASLDPRKRAKETGVELGEKKPLVARGTLTRVTAAAK